MTDKELFLHLYSPVKEARYRDDVLPVPQFCTPQMRAKSKEALAVLYQRLKQARIGGLFTMDCRLSLRYLEDLFLIKECLDDGDYGCACASCAVMLQLTCACPRKYGDPPYRFPYQILYNLECTLEDALQEEV